MQKSIFDAYPALADQLDRVEEVLAELGFLGSDQEQMARPICLWTTSNGALAVQFYQVLNEKIRCAGDVSWCLDVACRASSAKVSFVLSTAGGICVMVLRCREAPGVLVLRVLPSGACSAPVSWVLIRLFS